MKNEIITEIDGFPQLLEILNQNPGLVIVKFGAPWCGPCQRAEPLIKHWIQNAPKNVQYAELNIDDNFELYGYLKTKKMLKGIPAVLAWKQGNETYIPDATVLDSDENNINTFFKECAKLATEIN